MLATFTDPTGKQPDVPEYVRQAGVVDGVHVYFVIYPVFKHGASGPVVAYAMNVIADQGNAWTGGNYLIFPTVIGNGTQDGTSQPQAYLSVVPDGIRSVRWHFTCKQAPAGSTCQLPSTTASVTVPVHGNLAVLALTVYGTALPTVSTVTWSHADGATTVFRNQDSAVPFAGAPRWQG